MLYIYVTLQAYSREKASKHLQNAFIETDQSYPTPDAIEEFCAEQTVDSFFDTLATFRPDEDVETADARTRIQNLFYQHLN